MNSPTLFALLLNYPLWFILFCILTGAIYAGALYIRDQKLKEFSKGIIYLITASRFTTVSLIAFLLLSPFIKTISVTTDKPIIILAQDNSESIIQTKDSGFYRTTYPKKLAELIDKLSEKYEVRTYSFGDRVAGNSTFTYSEKQTDISALFNEVENRYSGRNVGALILASDGLYNKGTNPEYTSFSLNAPVYTIALGDTTIRKDLAIAKITHNRFAFLGNKFPVQININAHQLKGTHSELALSKNGERVVEQTIDINSTNFNSVVNLVLDAKESGIQRYHVKLSPVPGETNLTNNEQDFFIDIRDSREQILLIANAPHPDIAAIKDAIESNQNYEVELGFQESFTKPLKKYGMVILHQLNASAKIITDVKNSGLPVWFIGVPPALLPMGVSVPAPGNKTNDVEAILVPTFPLFTISDDLRKFMRNLPAIQCPFGNYKTGTAANVLVYQKIGIVETQTPLFVFNPNGIQKTALFAGDGLWRWRLRDYAEHGSHLLFNELICKTVQYLSTKVDKSFFRVLHENDFYENETIAFDAEVYNASYELINEPEVELSIINGENKKFPFTFTRTANAYRLNAGMLPAGQYRYEAKVKVGDKTYQEKGVFSVTALQVELVNTIADHHLLYNLAHRHGGSMVYPKELEKLNALVQQREDIKTVAYTTKKLTDLINVKLLFFTLLGLLTMEWFIRKHFGAY